MDTPAPEEIAVIGDIHGKAQAFIKAAKAAKEKGIKTLLQLGDFGYWEHMKDGEAFLKAVEKQLALYGQELIFIDGNHENHTLLRARYLVPDRRTPEGLYRVRENLFYAPRGTVFERAGVRFLAMGGAYSIDKDPIPEWNHQGRTPGKSWWPEETITDEEVEQAIAAVADVGVDVLLSHDCPAGVEIPTNRSFDEKFGKERWPETSQNRVRLRKVVDAAEPWLLLHGHYHHRYTELLELESGHIVEVHGFGHDGYDGFTAQVDFLHYVRAREAERA